MPPHGVQVKCRYAFFGERVMVAVGGFAARIYFHQIMPGGIGLFHQIKFFRKHGGIYHGYSTLTSSLQIQVY